MDLKPDETSKAVVPILACVLNQLCTRNDRLPFDQKNVSKFHALRPPAINIKDYLERISKYASCSGECFVLALIYIDRIIQINPTFVVNSLNIHRLLITSVMLGAKFFDDQYFNNAYYAKVGGVPCAEINCLEVEFLFMTNFGLSVTTDQYRQYYTELCNHVIHSNCTCSRSNIKVPPLRIPDIPASLPFNHPLPFPGEYEQKQSNSNISSSSSSSSSSTNTTPTATTSTTTTISSTSSSTNNSISTRSSSRT